MIDTSHPNPKEPIHQQVVLFSALFLSGAAGLVNQVVWQRALKVFLGGSETTSTLVVVLVFLAGIGLGSFYMGRRIHLCASPARRLAWVEVALVVTNGLICSLLTRDISESIYQFQRAALHLGVPLRGLYAVQSFCILFVPCFLMGTTLPLASEVCQRQLAFREARFIGWLYFFNTLGAVAGSLSGIAILLPSYGQRVALLVAAGLNGVSALILLLIRQARNNAPLPLGSNVGDEELSRSRSTVSGFAVLAFGFGFCSLWYEMFLYRAVALAHQPLPLVFSAVLAGFLLFWSMGAYASSLRSFDIGLVRILFATVITEVAALWYWSEDNLVMPLFTVWDSLLLIFAKIFYFIPCFLFGLLFGLIVKKSLHFWGRDVGWLSAWNTAGCCCGIILATFAGYEVNLVWMIAVQCLALLSLGGVFGKIERLKQQDVSLLTCYRPWFWFHNRVTYLLCGLTFAMFAALSLVGPIAGANGSITLWGRDGVISIDDAGNLAWDGLWHSRLSSDNNHVGTYNWALAADPVLAHPREEIRQALVIGLGTGITAATLSKVTTIEQVDVYDINQTLKGVLHRYPEGTLKVAENPKVRILWQDGRSGLALNNKTYDLITQQPLYLKQAGASILLSKEYFRTVLGRLNSDGVFCVYANGSAEQALAVRQTASEVFPHALVLHRGYQLILSRQPLDFSRARIDRRLAEPGELWEEFRQVRQKLGPDTFEQYVKVWELPLADSRITIRDDFPIVEYPTRLRRILSGFAPDLALPSPRFP